MNRWLYQSEGGGVYFDIGDGMARCLTRNKVFLGTDDSIRSQIVKWLQGFCGELNYVTMVKSSAVPLADAQIEANLKRFKRHKEIQLHQAQRAAGEYDVLSEVVVNPYTTTKFTIVKNRKVFIISDRLALMEIEKRIAKDFEAQGYYKTWRKSNQYLKPIKLGLAPEPVFDVTWIAAEYNLR